MWISGNIYDDWINDTKQNNKHNNMFNADANLKHVHTHGNNTWILVSALCLFVCSVSLVSSSFDSLHITLWLKSAPRARVCLSFHLTVIAMSHAHVEWLSLRPLHLLHFPLSSSPLASSTSFCSSTSLRYVDNSHVHCRWGVGSPELQVLLHIRCVSAGHQLVVRNLWRKVWLEATEQAFWSC